MKGTIMNTSTNDVAPRDPATAEPASAAPDDQALADILASDQAEPVEPGMLPTPHRPLVGWLIIAGVVVVVGAVIAAVTLVFNASGPPPSATPSSTPAEPSASTPSSIGTPNSGAKFLNVTILPGDGESPSTVISEGTVGPDYSYTVNPRSDPSSPVTVSVMNSDGMIVASCPLASGAPSTAVTSQAANGTVTNVVTAVTLTFKVNDDGTLTCVGS